MKTYTLLKKRMVHWDGREETGPEFGWGDFVHTAYDEISQYEANDEKEARKLARRLCKELGYRCLFSGVGYTMLLQEEFSHENS